MREELERTFEDNDDDYGRKLYLIENCLYGVDIQPIAIQISKLRFFISLICDQKTNRDKAKNHGIRPLPNLETKFVAADTLIGLPEMEQSLLVDPRVDEIEREIESLYHRHFGIQRRDQKIALQRRIKELRKELGGILSQGILSQGMMTPTKAQHVADWDAFDPQASADFFDPHWMFGKQLAGGFDIIIGNPPYVSYGLRGVGKIDKATKDKLCRLFPNSAEYKISMYALFMDKAIRLSSKNGLSTLIVPDSFLLGRYFSKIRGLVLAECEIHKLLLIRDKVFDNVTIGQSVIYLFKRSSEQQDWQVKVAMGSEDYFAGDGMDMTYAQNYFNGMERYRFRIYFEPRAKMIVDTMEASRGGCLVRDFVKFRSGLIAKAGQNTIKSNSALSQHWKPGISSGGSVDRFLVSYQGEFLCCEPKLIKSGGIGTVNYFSPKLFVRQTGDSIICAYDHQGLLALNNVHIGEMLPETEIDIKIVCAVLNSSPVGYFYKVISLEEGRAMAQIDIDMLDAIPIPAFGGSALHALPACVDLIQLAKAENQQAAYQFLEALIDACVMECYFREHMAERDLLFQDAVTAQLQDYDPEADTATQTSYLETLHTRLLATDLPQKLQSIPEKSPDLLGVILKERKV